MEARMRSAFPRLAALAVMAALATTGAVSAMSDSALEGQLRKYGFDVDASTLSNTQKASVQNALRSGDSHSDTKAAINGALRSN